MNQDLPISSTISRRPEHPFHAITALIAQTLSPNSRRIYQHTYDAGCEFADRFQIDYLDLSFSNIAAFLRDPDVAHDTRLSRKAHMLRLPHWLEESNDRDPWYAWQRRQILKFIRFRRGEEDIDLENQTVRIRHGKGDKERVASIADITNVTKWAFGALRNVQRGAYEYVFPLMTTGRAPEFASDKPMSASGVVRMLKIAVERSHVGHISAHDLRRTHITLTLDNEAPLQDMQAQAGHANASTTLHYAWAADAKARRERIAF